MRLLKDAAGRKRWVLPAGPTLTLGELRNFIRRLDAEGAADCTPIFGLSNLLGRNLRSLSAKIVRFGDPDDD